MPLSAPKPCTHPRCTKYAANGSRCEAHKIIHGWDHGGKSRHDRGYGSAWEKARSSRLKIDNHLCLDCLQEGIYTKASDVDHVIPKHKGGTDALDNLRSLCKPHHRAKTQREAQARRKGHGGC